MADPPSCPAARDDTGAEPGGKPAAGRPGRAILVWVIVIAVFLAMLILHLAGAAGRGTPGWRPLPRTASGH